MNTQFRKIVGLAIHVLELICILYVLYRVFSYWLTESQKIDPSDEKVLKQIENTFWDGEGPGGIVYLRIVRLMGKDPTYIVLSRMADLKAHDELLMILGKYQYVKIDHEMADVQLCMNKCGIHLDEVKSVWRRPNDAICVDGKIADHPFLTLCGPSCRGKFMKK